MRCLLSAASKPHRLLACFSSSYCVCYMPPLSKRRRYCVARRPSVTLCVCVHCINLGGEGNALYPVLSSCDCSYSSIEVITYTHLPAPVVLRRYRWQLA